VPLPSPYVGPKGELSAAAQRGKKLFESDKTACATCHPAPLFSDMKLYDVGTRMPLDQRGEFVTPMLVELYRTGPYLHMGEAVTLEEVLVKFNEQDKHGKTRNLTKEERADLVAYLMSL
jgi:cytochrome c peroxidase